MAENAEVRIKLVADDHASETVDKLKMGMSEIAKGSILAEQGAKAFGGAVGFAAGPAGAVLAAINLTKEALAGAYEIAKKFGEAALEAAEEEEKQLKAMTGLMGMMDRGAHSMQDIRDYAAEVGDELETAGIKTGVSGDKMKDMFDQIIQRGGTSTEKAKELTEQMAIVGKVIPGGMEGLAGGFSMMEMGMIRARNPLVQLIASTHTLQGNAHAVAAAMMKMTPEKQMELANKAITAQAEAMKKGGAAGAPSLAGLKESFEGVRAKFLEAMGKPMLDAIVGPLAQVRKYLLEHLEEIQEFGAKIGGYFAKAIEVVSQVTGSIYEAVIENWDAFATIGQGVFDEAREVFEYIYNNKDAFAATFKDFVHDFAKVIEFFANTIDAQVKVLKTVMNVASFGLVGGGGGKAGEQADIEKKVRAAAASPYEAEQKEIEGLRAKYIKNAADMGANAKDAATAFDNIYAWHATAVASAATVDAAAVDSNVGKIVEVYNAAAKSHNGALQQYAANVIAGSTGLQTELLADGAKLEGGLKEFAAHLKVAGAEGFAKEFTESQRKIKDIKGAAPTVNFPNATFNIKQDFKDQDPDRIALVFRKDIMKSVGARGQARTAGYPGL